MARGPWSKPARCTGRRLTSWPSLKTDIRNAGGTWEDAAAVVDHGLVTAKMVEEFAEGAHPGHRHGQTTAPDKRLELMTEIHTVRLSPKG